MGERIHASFTHRAVWLAACGLPVLILLVLTASSQSRWRHRAAALERENLNLRLVEVAREVKAESDQLAERARELAESELIAQVAQENSNASPDHAALLRLTRGAVDALVVLSASQTVKFSATTAGDRLTETAPAAGMMETRPPAGFGFARGRWIAARPIVSHAPSPAVLGWVLVARSMSPPLAGQLARSAGGAVVAYPSAAFDGAALPEDLLKPASAPTSGGMGVTTHVSSDGSAGYVALRDASGGAIWALRVAPSGLAAGSAAPGAASAAQAAKSGGIGAGEVLAGSSALTALLVTLLLAFKGYVRRQKSVAARYKAIIDQSNDGIVMVDAKTQALLYANPALLTRLGYSAAEAQALSLCDIFDDAGAATGVLARLRGADSHMALNMQQRCKSGTLIDIEVRCNALDVDGGGVLAYVTHDVSLRRKAEQQLIDNQHRLDRMAHHDQLTGLPNRHYLTAFLPDAIAEAQAANTKLGVVFLDLDRFKHINDTRGHETGDKLLQEVATRLRAVVRESDVVIRMGGDEFVVVFRNVKSYDEVTLGAGRIIETLSRPIIIDQHPLQTTGSVGVSLYPRDGSDMVELLKHSDTAMYQAKDRGRNNVQMFSQVMNRKLKHRVAVEASLREALRLKQLDVYYQPFINLLTRKVVGLEALMRWHHLVHGMVPADQFIPVAEETGLIVPMGNFVLHRTLQDMSAWRKAGVPLVPISLNIAPAQLQRGELQSTITTLLKTHGIRPDMLQLEMTERAMFESHAPAGENRQDSMGRLRDLGVKIAIDDFGTGYSSLSYLKHWRVDTLKIDRSFVRDLATDSSDLAIVSAIIAIARHLHIQVIAEGIEGYQQAEILRRLGCSVGQGFLFARPMAAAQCLELLGDNAQTDKAEEEDMLAVLSAGRG
jgi:diguanylate cyclase (GGDEF)-like protein/PAS domain S-box-containing protein